MNLYRPLFPFLITLSCLLFCASSLVRANEPTLEIEPFYTWIPTNGNKCQVVVTLTNAPGNGSVQFHLISSTWPGYCMNMAEETASEETASDKDLKSCPINGSSGESGRVGQAAAGRGCPASPIFLRFSSVLTWKSCNVSLTHV